MKDPLLEYVEGWDIGNPSSTTLALADALLQKHVALVAADKALAEAQHVRAVLWAQEREGRAALSEQMAADRVTRVERPSGSIFEIGARMKPEKGGGMKVLSLGCLRILLRRILPADPLFVLRQAEGATDQDGEGGPISAERRRVG